jgi:hypothetical protein
MTGGRLPGRSHDPVPQLARRRRVDLGDERGRTCECQRPKKQASNSLGGSHAKLSARTVVGRAAGPRGSAQALRRRPSINGFSTGQLERGARPVVDAPGTDRRRRGRSERHDRRRRDGAAPPWTLDRAPDCLSRLRGTGGHADGRTGGRSRGTIGPGREPPPRQHDVRRRDRAALVRLRNSRAHSFSWSTKEQGRRASAGAARGGGGGRGGWATATAAPGSGRRRPADDLTARWL